MRADPTHLPPDGLRVLESEDNTAVMDAARDALKLIHSQFLPAVGSWVQVGRAPAS